MFIFSQMEQQQSLMYGEMTKNLKEEFMNIRIVDQIN